MSACVSKPQTIAMFAVGQDFSGHDVHYGDDLTVTLFLYQEFTPEQDFYQRIAGTRQFRVCLDGRRVWDLVSNVSPATFCPIDAPVTGCSLARSALQAQLLSKAPFTLPLPVLRDNQLFLASPSRKGKPHLLVLLPDVGGLTIGALRRPSFFNFFKIWFSVGGKRMLASLECSCREKYLSKGEFLVEDFTAYRHGPVNVDKLPVADDFDPVSQTNWMPVPGHRQQTWTAIGNWNCLHIASERWEEVFRVVQPFLAKILWQDTCHVFEEPTEREQD